MSLRRYRWPAILLLALHLQACSTWRTSPLPVAQVMAEEPGSIRITTTEGATWTLEEPRLVGDSLTTALIQAYCSADRPEPCTADQVNGMPVRPTPLDEIASVEVRELSVGRTVGATALALFGALALLIAIECAGSEFFCE